MFKLIFLVLLVVPIIEIYLMIQVGQVIGAPMTILLLIGLAMLGTWLLRQQGMMTLQRVQASLAAGQMPAMELIEGMVIMVCGLLLVTPGFFTDVLGLIGLLPPVRRAVIGLLLTRGVTVMTRPRAPGPGGDEPRAGPRTLEGEWQREDDSKR